jgi:hypothetical protein
MVITWDITRAAIFGILEDMVTLSGLHKETRGIIKKILAQSAAAYEEFDALCDEIRPAIERYYLSEDGLMEFYGGEDDGSLFDEML